LVPRDCVPDEVRCAGDAEKTPQVCDETGHWIQNTDEAEAECPLLCAAGRCVECTDDKKRCSVCEEGDAACDPNQPQKCVDGAWQNDGVVCDSHCDGGGCVTAPSCDPLFRAATTCGDESCCTSLPVAGGSFKRDFDGQDFDDDSYPATIRSFLLDKYEVTVGRMRQFANAYNELSLKDGQGKSAYIVNDGGWNTSFAMPKDRDELVSQLKCDGGTWSDIPASNSDNNLPINCVPFAVAYAFCIWDGGRLPTEAEWNYAAAGGDEQRVYPWKTPVSGPPITSAYANYMSLDNPDPLPTAVGSKNPGAGRWGQLDLSGNVAEWTLDYSASYPEECSDCLNSTPAAARAYRGGSYLSDEFTTVVSVRSDVGPTQRYSYIGFRCARELN
jgi:formylglycine-generating enzyme required for sulfatase activity